MKKFLTYLLFAICISVIGAYAQPKLTIEGGNILDLGKINIKDGNVNAAVTLKNEGNTPLIISDIRTSSNDVTAIMLKTEIPAGEKSFIHIRFNPENSSGTALNSISFVTNDRDKLRAFIQLKAEVITPIQVYPPTILIQGTESGTNSISIKLINNTNEEVSVSNFDAPENITLSFDQNIIPPNSDISLTVTLDGTNTDNAKISFSTSHPDYQLVEIPVYVRNVR